MNSDIGKAPGLAGINPARLFLGSCFSLISTAVCFAVVADIMGALKGQFVLSNEQVGAIAGAATFGFTFSIFAFGPFCDALGMRFLLRLAFLGHFLGVLLMILAKGYWMLWGGAFIISLGNGLVEAACNPLVTTIYPEQKTRKLNQFHVWFPGGIVIGGLMCFALDKLNLSGSLAWQIKLGAILLPTIVYGILFTGQKFPATERVQSGISFGGMCKETFGRPLFWLLLFCMMITASLELGPQRWVPSVLKAGGIPGPLVLVWITGLMAVLRFFAGPIVHKLSPTGILVCSAILAGLGLTALSFAESIAVAFAAATVFAVGVCYFWPTMLGVTAERVPKGGSLALALMGGIGMLAVGSITTPQMGKIADQYVNAKLDPAQTKAVLEKVVATYPELKAKADAKTASDFDPGIKASRDTLAELGKGDATKATDTANALRAVIKSAPKSDAGVEADKLLQPADNFGGRMSFRKVAPFSLIIIVVFGLLFAIDKTKGGYKVEHLSEETERKAAALAGR